MSNELGTSAGTVPTVVAGSAPSTGSAAIAAVSAMYTEHVHAIHAYVARRLGPALAPDVTAETFRIALERYTTYDDALGSARGWLYGIASNLIRGHWRTEQRRLRALGRAAMSEPSAPEPMLQVEERTDAAAALARVLHRVEQLSADDRDLLTLFAWERCSYAEIAAALEVPVGTVRSRLHRIRTALAPTSRGKDHPHG